MAQKYKLEGITVKHNLSKTRLYSIYSGMKQRCYNPKNQHYQWYGAKNITICDEWMGENGLQNFIEWSLNHGYEEHLTIDRKNNDKGYSPDNCQWITISANTSKSHYSSTIEDGSIRNEIKSEIAKSGWTLTDIVKEMNKLHPSETTTSQNISNKLTRGTLKYSEAKEIAFIIGCKIEWMPIANIKE